MKPPAAIDAEKPPEPMPPPPADAVPAGRLADGLQRMLRPLVDVRPGETAALLAAFLLFFCLLTSYYLLRPLRDALGLAGGAAGLPWLFSATFVVMLAAVPAYGALASRLPPRRFVPRVWRFFAASFLVVGALFAAGVAPLATVRSFFVWISVFNLFVVSIFWSVMADSFDNGQARRLYGFVAAGGTAGTFVGPALAAGMASSLGPAGLAVAAALLLEAALRCLRAIQRLRRLPRNTTAAPAAGTDGPPDAPGADRGLGDSALAGLALIARSRYLQGLALYLLLLTVGSTFLYVEQGRIVAASFADTAARTRWFALVDLAVSALTLVLQLAVTGRLLRRFGVVPALVALPAAAALAYGGLALWPGLAALAAGQTLRRAMEFALARPAREVLWTVVGREARYKAKSVVDTVVYRGGDALAGWLSAGVAALGIGFAATALGALPLAALWAALGVWLGRRQDDRLARRPAAAGTGDEEGDRRGG